MAFSDSRNVFTSTDSRSRPDSGAPAASMGAVNDSISTDYGAWLRIRPQGAQISGNYFGWGANNEHHGLGRAIEILGDGTGGVVISGNRIQTPTAIRVNGTGHSGYVIQGNHVTTRPGQSVHQGLESISTLVIQGNHQFP